MENHRHTLAWAWRAALAFFVLAGLTGALYRFGLARGWTLGFDLTNIRHAHSHLMYFGWATPAVMAIIGLSLPVHSQRPAGGGLRWILLAAFAGAAVAYPLFLTHGYAPTQVLGRPLPLSMVAAGLNVLVWYAFIIYYARATRGIRRTRALLLWDLALTFLFLATLGAWGLALLQPFGVESPAAAAALTHVFLDLFSEGWFVLAVLGIVVHALWPEAEGGHWGITLLVLGLPVTFILGMPESLVAPSMRVVGRVGGLLAGGGLAALVVVLWRHSPATRGWLWKVPLALLGLKAAAQVVVGLSPGVWWASEPGLRILYLHVALLGFVTLGTVAGARVVWPGVTQRLPAPLFASVILLILSLIPLTVLWPSAWYGSWVFLAAACVAPLPPVVTLITLATDRASIRRPSTPRPAPAHTEAEAATADA